MVIMVMYNQSANIFPGHAMACHQLHNLFFFDIMSVEKILTRSLLELGVLWPNQNCYGHYGHVQPVS